MLMCRCIGNMYIQCLSEDWELSVNDPRQKILTFDIWLNWDVKKWQSFKILVNLRRYENLVRCLRLLGPDAENHV